MTQAANLAALGSNVNSSGQTSLTAGVSGTLPVANGGTGDERAEKEKLLAVKNNPEALRGVLDSYTRLLGGQLKELKTQYESNGGKNWDPKVSDRTMYAISESHLGRTLTDQERQAIQWARANSKDPRAEKIRNRCLQFRDAMAR